MTAIHSSKCPDNAVEGHLHITDNTQHLFHPDVLFPEDKGCENSL